MEIDNLCTQQDLTEEKLIETLKERYEGGQIYTNSGLFLLSLNPYAEVDLYDNAVVQMYKRNVVDLKPHVFSLLNTCISDSAAYGSHSILITGDSGSGKTETARRMLQYLGIEEMTHANVLLESFGNARTEKNNNSSRFGKLLTLHEFVSIQVLLLERSRVTNATLGCNFHVFYLLLSGNNISLHNGYISHTAEPEEVAGYEQLKAAAAHLGIDFWAVEQLLLGILYLGSVRIQDGAVVPFPEYEEMLERLALKRSAFEELLTRKTLEIGGEVIHKPYSEAESMMIRDSIARLLYASLFDSIVFQINEYLRTRPVSAKNLNILDIFGFESFEENGLDQFCINWCNERIYDNFVKETLEDQERVLEEEGIRRRGAWQMPPSRIEQIEGKCGIADLAGETALLGGTAEGLAIKIEQFQQVPHCENTKIKYRHYAGTVKYDMEDFIAKNRERCCIRNVYDAALDEEGSPRMREFIAKKVLPHAPGRSSVNLIRSFREDLDRLFGVLCNSRVKYVRCIKPNNGQKAFYFDRAVVSAQLCSSGVLQSVEISKKLFPYSMFIDEFEERYSLFSADLSPGSIVQGRTRCFFNNDVFVALESSRAKHIAHIHNIIGLFIRSLYDKVVTLEGYEEERRAESERMLLESKQVGNNKDDDIEILTDDNFINDNRVNNGHEKFSELRYDLDKLSEILHSQLQPNLIELQCDLKELANSLQEDAYQNISELQNDIASLQDNLAGLTKNLNNEVLAKTAEPVRVSREQVTEDSASSERCLRCETLERKYNVQTMQLLRAQRLEEELARCREKLRSYESESDSMSCENSSLSGVFGCLVQLYLDYVPAFSTNDVPKEEMHSLAHGILFILGILDSAAFASNLSICVDEVNRRLAEFEQNTSKLAFILSNMIELRVCLSGVPGDSGISSVALQLDVLVERLFSYLCVLQKRSLDDLLPGTILDYQHLKEFKEKEHIFRKMLGVKPVSRLTRSLEDIYNVCVYFYLPDVFIINSISYMLSYVDFVVFNSLLSKKKFLSMNRCIQINYNISEVEKFCLAVEFSQGMYNMAYTREALRVAFEIAHGEKTLQEIAEHSFLSWGQFVGIVSLFESRRAEKVHKGEKLSRFIDEPQVVVPSVEGLRSTPHFVHPKFLPENSIKNILKKIEDVK